jgi:hypothetical protein
MSRPWEVDPDAQFKRRLGKTAAELGDSRVVLRASPAARARAWTLAASPVPPGPRVQAVTGLLVLADKGYVPVS